MATRQTRLTFKAAPQRRQAPEPAFDLMAREATIKSPTDPWWQLTGLVVDVEKMNGQDVLTVEIARDRRRFLRSQVEIL